MFKNWNRKKTVLVIIIGSLLMAAGISIALVLAGRGKKEAALLPPQFYFAKSDEIPSVTDVIGDREFEKLPEAAESSEAAETVSETASQTDSQSEGASVEKYRYFSSDTSEMDVKEYVDYLMENNNFLDISGEEDKPEDDTEKVSTYRLAGPSEDKESYLEITITMEDGSYTVTAVKEGKSWNSYISRLWEDEKKDKEQEKQAEPGSTRQIAEEKVQSMSQKELGLPEPVSSYAFIAGPGLVHVDGKDFYRVSAYKKHENGTLTYECAYLMDYASKDVCFKYDDVTEETEPLK